MTPPDEAAAEAPKKKRVRRSFGPYTYDAKTAKEVILNLKIGCPVVLAVSTAGISRATLYNWVRRGKKENQECRKTGKTLTEMAKFYRDFRKALGAANRMHVQTVFSAAANGNADVAKWWLSRRMPQFFGPKPQEVVMTGKRGGAPIAVESRKPEDMTSDEIARRLQELEAKALSRAAAPLVAKEDQDEDDDGDPGDDADS
jgi:hypothetical protein